ncbi:hypothetical protein LTS08_001320 [Lithohypha guttulata]|uniref:Uncharacterized protein n=1 Tax=Lithohypha guttulata TaxID=1690604 RepID=A0AAN7SUC5_9EURO|nr:hypothetical protein LTR51_004013 [Lithohypha guttulata]KAK5081740.1 hypothetical protein LTR05_007876 [Lithohypha guttulata]KAK5105047.1 hypothetical protein LTS08_001320 [Lithohypha guttulata]
MAPNPIMLPRKRKSLKANAQLENDQAALGLTWPILTTAFVALLLAISVWPRRWLLSGCGVQSLLIAYAAGYGSRIFPSIPLWVLLISINLVYAVAATSWLLYGLFTAACWPFILLTCLFQFQFASEFARRNLRRLLRDLYFTQDRIAFFNLPALEIDTEVAGLMVIRGITFSLSGLTLVAHGIEVGIKLTDEIELALHADEVRVSLFRRIEVGNVYGNIKGGRSEMTFTDLDDTDHEGAEEDALFYETPLLRAATAGSEGIKDRPKLRESLAGGSYIKDSSAKSGFGSIRTLSPDDQDAEKKYDEMINEIRTSDATYQSRARVRKATREQGRTIDDEKDLRAAVCAELHEFPSIPHPPRRSIKVTTLQKLNPPRVRRFLHRLPFLLRLLLNPLGYFHPITIDSISAAGSGQWLRELLQTNIFKHHAAKSAELRRLQKRISVWLEDANFCLELTDIDGLGQVPLSTQFDIVAYLHFADIMAYRTLPQSGILNQVVRLGGADATFTIPSYLLPHHEHVLPPRPTAEDKKEMEDQVEQADGIPKMVQAEQEMEMVKKDEASISMSVHASLPAAFDRELLMFIAALVKATKIIEFDKEVDKVETEHATDKVDHASETASIDSSTAAPLTPVSTNDTVNSVSSTPSIMSRHSRVSSDITPSTTGARFKNFTKNLQHNLREASLNTKDSLSKDSIKTFMQEVQQNTRDGMKKAVVGSMVNDRWIAKLVGKVAANLERAQGDLGYSGGIPVALEDYRPKPGDDGMLSKFLP